MDLETTIFVLVLILSIAIPIVILNRKKTQHEKEFVKMFFDLAKKNGCTISEYDIWNNSRVIGIDPQTHKLFFIKRVTGTIETEEINLLEIQKCKVINTNRIFISKDSRHKVIDKLEVVFTYSDQKKTDKILEFYNTECDSLIIDKELHLTEKWSEIANKNIAGINLEK